MIWLRCTQLEGREIWGNVDEDETTALAKLLLKRGQRSPAAATLVRGMIDSHDYITVGALFVPRIADTVKALREAPKRERKPIRLFRTVQA